MPTSLDLPDPETGRIIPVTHYYITDVARMFHTNRYWIREQIDAGIFPSRRINGRPLMSAEHVAQALAIITTDAGAVELDEPEELPRPRLGTVVDPDEIGGVR